MSITKRILFGAGAAWFGRGSQVFLGLILLPVLFRTLPSEELGIWLLLGQSWAMLAILDLGFGVTLTRRIAFAKAKSGIELNASPNAETRQEIADLVTTGLFIYRALAVLAFAVSFCIGLLYLRTLTLEQTSLATVSIAWGILCLSQALTLAAAPWTCLLQGVGYIGWDAILVSFVNAITVIAQIATALLGGRVVALAIVAAIGAMAQRATILGFSRRNRPDLFQLSGTWQPAVLRSMVPLALRAWLTGLGSAMILYTDQMIIASMEGAAELPAYRAAWVLVHNLTIVGVTFGVASVVFVSQLWQVGDVQQVHRVLERNVRLGWLVTVTGAVILLLAGDALFTLWLGTGNFIGYPILITFLVSEALETQSYIIASTSRSTGDEPFAFCSIAAGIIKLVLSVLLAKEMGLLGVALGSAIALLLTNHWYIPFCGLRRLNYSRWRFIKRIVAPSFLTLAAMLIAAVVARQLVPLTSPLLMVLSVTAAAVGVSAFAFWFLVLEPHQRFRLVAMLLPAPHEP
jgi:O-antigen/teichoic acid export membrane protein